MLAFTINVLYLISLLFVPNPPVEAKDNPYCAEIAAVLTEAVEDGQLTSEEAAELIVNCEGVEVW